MLANYTLGQAPLAGSPVFEGGAIFRDISARITASSSAYGVLTLVGAAPPDVGVDTWPPVVNIASNLFVAANNVESRLALAITTSDMTITVVDASRFPTSGAITIDRASGATALTNEIAYYNGKSGNILTITTRGADGTTAKAFNAAAKVQMRITAAHHNILANAVINLETAVDGKASQAEVDAKADIGHTHTTSEVTGLDASLAAKLPLAGGTLTGALTLASGPTTSLHPATKQYVDLIVMPLVYNAKAYGLAGNGTTDDTVALQALIDLVAAAGGGRIYFPKGVYLIGGALQDTSGSNAQIIFPIRSETSVPMTIDFVGETTPVTWLFTQPKPTGDGYSIFKSTLTGGSGNASMFGGKVAPASPNTNQFMANFKDLVFELAPNPSITAIDCSNQTGSRFEHLLLHDGTVTESHNEPTHLNSYAIKCSPTNHSSHVVCASINVIGFATAVRIGELTQGTIIGQGCRAVLEVPFAHHPSVFTHIGNYGCPYGIVSDASGTCGLRIDLFSIQDDTGFGQPWQDKVADIYDPSNLLHGSFNWFNVLGGVGVTHTLVKNGGANFIGTELW